MLTAGWTCLRIGPQEIEGTQVRHFWKPSLNLQGLVCRVLGLNSDGLAEVYAQRQNCQVCGYVSVGTCPSH